MREDKSGMPCLPNCVVRFVWMTYGEREDPEYDEIVLSEKLAFADYDFIEESEG